MSHSAGDQVYAKWVGSGLRYPATVVKASGDNYTVEFNDGSREKMSAKDITSEKRMRSRSPSRRSRSRSRSRGRSKSPARTKTVKAKSSPSPARKSPSRIKSKTPSTTPVRQSARVAAIELKKEEQEKENAAVQRQQPQSSPPKKETPKKRAQSSGRQMAALSKAAGVVLGPGMMLFFMVFIPVFIVGFNVSCGKSKCTMQELPQVPTTLSKYFNLEVVGVFCAYVTVLFVLANMPVGKVITIVTKKSGKRPQRRANAFFSSFVILATFGVMVYMKQPVSYLYRYFLQFLATSIVFGILVSVAMLIKGRNAPQNERSAQGNTGNFIVDLIHGPEMNPRVGLFNFKYFMGLHFMMNGMLLVNLSMLAHDYLKTGQVNVPATMVGAFQALYVLSFLFNEEEMYISNRDVHDGFGYVFSVWTAAAPFFYTFPVRFLIQHPQIWSYYTLAGLAFLNFVGYVMMFGSLLQKSQFRRNPHDPALSNLDRIPTPNGKGLLVGGWWSICRKPNYLGELIQYFTWTFFCGFEFGIPYIMPVFLLLILVDRIGQDERECRVTHGAAWDRYTQRVRSRIIPKIY